LIAAKNISFDKRGNTESSVAIFEPATGRDVQTFPAGQGLGSSLAFSFDGKFLASKQAPSQQELDAGITGFDKLGRINIYETATWRVAREIKGSGVDFSLDQSSLPMTFSPDGKLLAASQNTGIALFDAASGARMQVLRTSRKESALTQALPNRDELMRQQGIDPEQLKILQETMPSIAGMMDMQGMGGMGKKVKLISGSQINFSPDGKLLSAVPLPGSFSALNWDLVSGTPRQLPASRDSDPMTAPNPLNSPVSVLMESLKPRSARTRHQSSSAKLARGAKYKGFLLAGKLRLYSLHSGCAGWLCSTWKSSSRAGAASSAA
jgi:WD40 repeat protein